MATQDEGIIVRWDRIDAVAVVTMCRPDRLNALSVPLTLGLIATLEEIASDSTVRSAVLTGEGRAFCSGADLADAAERLAEADASSRLQYMRTHQALISTVRKSRLPIVAAVGGLAYGAGWSLALACDLLVASREARFCQVFVQRGLVPDLGSAWLLPRAAGALHGKELMLLGDEISAERAFQLGLVNRLADSAEHALEVALELGRRLAEAPPATISMAKSLINESEHGSLQDSLALEQHAQSIALGTTEAVDALHAFLEKRGKSERGKPARAKPAVH